MENRMQKTENKNRSHLQISTGHYQTQKYFLNPEGIYGVTAGRHYYEYILGIHMVVMIYNEVQN